VLVDAMLTADQARALGDWVAAKGKNLTTIYMTHQRHPTPPRAPLPPPTGNEPESRPGEPGRGSRPRRRWPVLPR
jgi:hypothetical protein